MRVAIDADSELDIGGHTVAEALVFTHALTDAEIGATEGYLQKKWFGTAVRARAVRIGSEAARFEAVGGTVIIDELRMDVPGLSPTNALAGVTRIERLVVSESGAVLGNAARTGLPYDINELRVENGAAVTVDTTSAGAVWLSLLSGTVSGASVLVRELAPAASGLAVSGHLVLDFYQKAAASGAVIRLDALPAPGVAAVGVTGNVALAARGTVVLGEARAGVFKVLAAGGTLSGAADLVNWSLDASALPNAAGYTYALFVQDNAVMLKISAKGTVILIR
jgi:hypothetical protein